MTRKSWNLIFQKAEEIALEGDRIAGWIPQGEKDKDYDKIAEYINHLISIPKLQNNPPYQSSVFNSMASCSPNNSNTNLESIIDNVARNFVDDTIKETLNYLNNDSNDLNTSYYMEKLNLEDDNKHEINESVKTENRKTNLDDSQQPPQTKKLKISHHNNNTITEILTSQQQQNKIIEKSKTCRLYKRKGTQTSLYKQKDTLNLSTLSRSNTNNDRYI